MRVLHFSLLIAWMTFPGVAQQFGGAENLAPYVPTPQIVVERMLEAGHVKPGDVVYDLGSGDGRVVITAVQKFGALAVGVELLPDLCRKTEQRIKALGLADRIRMVEGSALSVDLSPANVVTMFFTTLSNERLKPNLEKHLKIGARVVSNAFPVRGWRPTEVVRVKSGKMEHTIFVYEIGRLRP
jgi:predicted RNA methylase